MNTRGFMTGEEKHCTESEGAGWLSTSRERTLSICCGFKLEQMELLHDCAGLVAGFKAQKLDRLEKRLRGVDGND